MGPVSPSLTVKCLDGLSNRLRVLLSGKAAAEATGREFAMRWAPTSFCGCLFEHLFQNEWNVRGDIPFDDAAAHHFEHVPQDSLPDVLQLTEPVLYLFHHNWLIVPARYPAHRALQVRCGELMDELEPVRSVARQINDFRERFFRPVMIGAHVRRGDRMRTGIRWRGNIPAIMRQVDLWLDAAYQAGILLCTDDGAPDPLSGSAMMQTNTAEQFVRRYGERVVFTAPTSLDRRTPRAIQSALVDLWLLRDTDFFVGTPGSSFSELAVLGRSIPFVLPA